jgi:hypothetical protein
MISLLNMMVSVLEGYAAVKVRRNDRTHGLARKRLQTRLSAVAEIGAVARGATFERRSNARGLMYVWIAFSTTYEPLILSRMP